MSLCKSPSSVTTREEEGDKGKAILNSTEFSLRYISVCFLLNRLKENDFLFPTCFAKHLALDLLLDNFRDVLISVKE